MGWIRKKAPISFWYKWRYRTYGFRQRIPNRSPAQRVRFGAEEQRRERALTFEKSRSKRYKACSDVVRVTGFEPAASWTPFKRDTKLRHTRIFHFMPYLWRSDIIARTLQKSKPFFYFFQKISRPVYSGLCRDDRDFAFWGLPSRLGAGTPHLAMFPCNKMGSHQPDQNERRSSSITQ